jgi:alpha-galactosidase
LSLPDLRGELFYRAGRERYSLRFGATAAGEIEDGRVRLEIERRDGRFSLSLTALEDVTVEALSLSRERPLRHGDRFFLNGYQSWTDTREFGPHEEIPAFPPLLAPALRGMLKLNRYGDYDIAERRGRHLHGFTYLYVRPADTDAIELIGSLSEEDGFTIFYVLPEEGRISVVKDCAGLLLQKGRYWPAFRLYLAEGPDERVFDEYLEQYLVENRLPSPKAPPAAGWTSWYHHYTAISEEIALKNLDAFARRGVPIDVFQIDDGWQGAVGDWLIVNDKFPRGMRHLADRIHEAGFQAGLWLAPFVAEKASRLLADHPQWALRDGWGRPIPAGNNGLWSGDFYALDIDHPGFRDYLKRVFDTVLGDWGFDLVKLDFLYGACIAGRTDRTRGQVMTEAMAFLRELCGDKKILGCGVPLGPAFGRVEYCRIGPDVGHEWGNTITRGTHLREGISTIVALENAIGRRHLGGRVFQNDPDVFFLRDLTFAHERFDPFVLLQELRHGKRRPLTERERYTLFLLNHVLGGLVFTSDDLDDYDAATLDLYLSAFPLRPREDLQVRLIGAPPTFQATGGFHEIRFRIGARRYRIFANLSEELGRCTLDRAAFGRDEHGRGRLFVAGEEVTLAPHASLCLLEDSDEDIALLGSESSLLPGADIECFLREGPDTLVIRRHPRARGRGRVLVRVPPGMSGLCVNGTFVPAASYDGRDGILLLDAEALPTEGA